MKRSKNIFNSPIAPQSLLEQEGNRQFRVGGISIDSNWLKGVNPQDYRRYILSTIRLSQLQKELQELKDNDQNSPIKQSNSFKIGNIKKKIHNFDLIPLPEQLNRQKDQNKNNEAPKTDTLIIQKITGFFNSALTRKCRIQNKLLYIQSQRDSVRPWIQLPIFNYTIQLQLKQKPLNNEIFKAFVWLPENQHRILLWGQKLRPYCLYGKEQQLKNVQRYFQVQKLQTKKSTIFKHFNTQLQQKIITIFGNKVRFFDHNMKIRRAQKQSQLNLFKNMLEYAVEMEPSHLAHSRVNKEKDESSSKEKQSNMAANSDLSKSRISLPHQSNPNPSILASIANALDTSKDKQGFFKKNLSIQKEKEPQTKSQVFKLRLKSSTVFYDEIQQPISGQKGQKNRYTVKDINLGLKQDGGISENDQQDKGSFNQSVRGSAQGSIVRKESSNKKSTNKRQMQKKVIHMSLQNELDQSQYFSINIHQITAHDNSSLNREGQFENKSVSELSMRSHTHSPNYISNIALSQIHKPQSEDNFLGIQRHNIQDMDFMDFILETKRPQEEKQSSDSQKSSSIESIKTRKNNQLSKMPNSRVIRDLKNKKLKNQIDILQVNKPKTIHFAVQQIRMFMPYNCQQIQFQILQVDMQLEMQRTIVACARTSSKFKMGSEKQKYMYYTIQGGHHFMCSDSSDQFIFVLKEPSKNHYIRFWTNPKPKYQRNCSQFLMTTLDLQGFPFSFSLIMYSSPRPVKLTQLLSTKEFLLTYLKEGESYDFKHDFIDDKRKRQLLRSEWNKVIINAALKDGDTQNFSKAVFFGMSQSIFKKLKKSVDYNPESLFVFGQAQLRLMQDNILSAGVMDLRSFLKPVPLMRYIFKCHKNKLIQQRLEQLCVYFLHRYGSMHNLALLFVKEVIVKLQPILSLARNQEEVFAIIDLYFEVQYQLDQLFEEISRYFKK